MESPGARRRIGLGTDDLIYEVDGPAAWLTFNRPHTRNAMTWTMYEGLSAACERVDADETIRVFVLRGAGIRRSLPARTSRSSRVQDRGGCAELRAHLESARRPPGGRPEAHHRHDSRYCAGVGRDGRGL